MQALSRYMYIKIYQTKIKLSKILEDCDSPGGTETESFIKSSLAFSKIRHKDENAKRMRNCHSKTKHLEKLYTISSLSS